MHALYAPWFSDAGSCCLLCHGQVVRGCVGSCWSLSCSNGVLEPMLRVLPYVLFSFVNIPRAHQYVPRQPRYGMGFADPSMVHQTSTAAVLGSWPRPLLLCTVADSMCGGLLPGLCIIYSHQPWLTNSLRWHYPQCPDMVRVLA